MIQFLLAAPRSGSGKTTMTCALLMALKRRGCAPCAFKSGPDYIDPMFHRAVLGVESRSLDLFFSAPETVRTLYAKGAAGHGAAVCEGAMGFYDGLGGVSDRASAWHLADTLGLPVLLVVEPKGQSLTLAAELNGLVNFRTPSHIAGILLNNCTARMHVLLAPMLEKETGLPVLGFLPKLPEAVIGSRHLGLYTAAEVENLQQKLALLADAAEEHIDWPRLLALCEKEPPALPVQPDCALVDGNRAPDLPLEVRTIIKGDAQSASIAAASILAKVSRDRYMLQMAEKYPQYAFEKHKGYGTKLHYERLEQYGISPIHRLSFLKKWMNR